MSTGLFAGLLFDLAGLKNFEILECSNRVGGRVLTKYFSDVKEDKLYGEYGAMRLPKSKCDNCHGQSGSTCDNCHGHHRNSHGHQMVFDTICYLNKINKYAEDYRIDLINFIFTDAEENGRYFYNNKRDESCNIMTQKYADENFDALGFPQTVSKDYRKLYEDALSQFFDELDKDIRFGIKKLMEYDGYSVYSYLKEIYLPGKIPKEDIEETIAAMEMTESATGLFRLAFTEAVMDGYTFLHKNQEWKTIKYGMQRFPDAFKPTLEEKYIKYNRKVFKLKNEGNKVRVYWEGDDNGQIYDEVIVTCPLGVVRQWELPDELDKCSEKDYIKRRAIRELNYDNSAKIFLKFKSRFWERGERSIVGGNSSTDLPIRTVIYPSYYVGDSTDKQAILLGSYTWANDAAKYAPYSQKENVKLCLKNLKTLHPEANLDEEWCDVDPEHGDSSIYWPNEPTTVGAFALFGPSQYTNLLYKMLKDSNSNIHWAGEHTDIHHAWIIGALNSAVRVVKEVLYRTNNVNLWNNLLNSDAGKELLCNCEWLKCDDIVKEK
ncbi:hypothetical protein RclHR1_00770017 [Rhizophagus clarus]|uniref:Amine oxidase domain-containing protein n=1 Tax=Rhizophagus clarus TaxID=94130 RepID=A0A2Z6RY71_9GLOM|nr:hypothetical protein RclHR1_00770017 [Rhizophagus clarus]